MIQSPLQSFFPSGWRNILRPLWWGIPVIIVLYGVIPAGIYPAEDATILYRYSENLAETGVISFNPGGERTEGATDFLWMVLLWLLYKVGINCYVSALLLSVGSVLGSYYLLLLLAGNREDSGWIPAFILAALLFNSQGMAAIQGFSVAFYGFWALICGWFFWRDQFSWLVISTLVLALVRPDGLVIGAPLVVGALWLQRQAIQVNIRQLLLYGVIPGLIYFTWRYVYFGLLFPLPFYVKSQAARWAGFLVPGSLFYEIGYLSKYLFPLLIVIGIAWIKHTSLATPNSAGDHQLNKAKLGWLMVAFIGCPLIFYAAMALEQNIADRFMYPVHLGVLVCFVLMIQYAAVPRQLLKWAGMIYLALSFAYFMIYLKGTLEISTNNIYPVARELSQYPVHTMAVTEAGRLPYYSGWETLDLWGLNSPALSRVAVQKAQLISLNPDLIVLDVGYDIAGFLAKLPRDYSPTKSWENVMANAYLFAEESGNYEILLVPFQQKKYLPAHFSPIVQGIQHIINWKGRLFGITYPAPYSLNHLYFLNRTGTEYPLVRSILINHGATPPSPISPTPIP